MHYRVNLSKDERNLILVAGNPSEELTRRLRFGVSNGQRIQYELDEDVYEELLALAVTEAVRGKTRADRRRYSRLEEKLRKTGVEPFAGVTGEDLPGILPPEVKAEIHHALMTDESGSLEEANEALGRITDKYNRRPRKEFRGLSPAQVALLLYTEWNTPDSPLRLNANLQLCELTKAAFFQRARVFLGAISSTPAKATATGNLNRKFVALMLEEMAWPDGYLDELHRFNKVVNEEDAWSVHILRIVLQRAGLIRKYKGFFRTTKKGDNYREETNANKLYISLFLTYFRDFNLAYLDRCPPCPSVQQTLAYSLYFLRTNVGKWINANTLSNDIFLPAVNEEMETETGWDYKGAILENRVIAPLESFGLIECQRRKGQYRLELKRVRTTLLLKEFITFDN